MIPPEVEETEKMRSLLPENQADGSQVGVNYVDAYLKALSQQQVEGQKILCKRRGLKISLRVGSRKSEVLLRRLEHGPDVRQILARALEDGFSGLA